MVRLGRYFKAPPRRAGKQWLKVELLYAFGERFVSGYSGLDKACATLAMTIAYLTANGHDESAVRGRLEQIRALRGNSN